MKVDNATFKSRAKAALQNNYWKAFLVCFLTTAIMGAGTTVSTVMNNPFTNQGIMENEFSVSVSYSPFASIGSLVTFLLAGTLTVGAARFFLNLANSAQAGVEDLFSAFKHYGNTFVMGLLTALFTFLWSLLFIIPGIIKSLGYFAAPYILAEHPEIKAKEALKMSEEMMQGHKKDLFLLELSFIGWFILAAVPLGLGLPFLMPYYQATMAEFFNEVSGNNYEKYMNGTAENPESFENPASPEVF